MENDSLRELWLQSEENEMEIDMAALRSQSTDLGQSVTRRNMVEMFAAGAVAIFFGTYAMSAPTLLGSVAGASLAVGAVVVAATFVRRGTGPAVNPGGTTVDFLAERRAQLVHQAELLESVPYWYVGPFVPGLTMLAVSTFPSESGLTASWASSIAVQVVGVAFVLWLNRRAALGLRASIEELPTAPRE